jgi:hypothetical protein
VVGDGRSSCGEVRGCDTGPESRLGVEAQRRGVDVKVEAQ